MLTHDKSSHGLWPGELKTGCNYLLAFVLYQICVFGTDLKSNMAARGHNVFSLAEILKIFLSETTKPIEL
jgi:hypothetical protein